MGKAIVINDFIARTYLRTLTPLTTTDPWQTPDTGGTTTPTVTIERIEYQNLGNNILMATAILSGNTTAPITWNISGAGTKTSSAGVVCMINITASGNVNVEAILNGRSYTNIKAVTYTSSGTGGGNDNDDSGSTTPVLQSVTLGNYTAGASTITATAHFSGTAPTSGISWTATGGTVASSTGGTTMTINNLSTSGTLTVTATYNGTSKSASLNLSAASTDWTELTNPVKTRVAINKLNSSDTAPKYYVSGATSTTKSAYYYYPVTSGDQIRITSSYLPEASSAPGIAMLNITSDGIALLSSLTSTSDEYTTYKDNAIDSTKFSNVKALVNGGLNSSSTLNNTCITTFKYTNMDALGGTENNIIPTGVNYVMVRDLLNTAPKVEVKH